VIAVSRVHEVRPVTLHEFGLFQALVEQELGIHLSEAKQALVNARLMPRIRELGLTTFGDYYDLARGGDPRELRRLLDAICTNETHFFREPGQFEILEHRLIPRWVSEADAGLRPRRVSIWSAGCSTGEEPYSLAMTLRERLPADFDFEILASDVSEKALGRARAATYSMQRLEEIPEALHKRYLLRGVREQEGRFRIGPELRRYVRFEPINLLSIGARSLGPFDLVLCRNVLIYFKRETRFAIVGELCGKVKPGGHLFVGHAESLHGANLPISTLIPTVYRVGAAGGAA
jgi:chemotaxis protein methyltransferase CheR